MFKTVTVFTALLALPLAAMAQTPAPSPGPVVAIENVTVIPMDSERVLRDHTVVVEGRRITAVGPAAHDRVPDGATRIDGRGKFLLPGLTEMHGALPGRRRACSSTARRSADRLLYLNVACGVTTRARDDRRAAGPARARGGRARRCGWGRRSSPRGRRSTAPACPTSRAAWRAVTEQRAAGYDLLKIHPGVPRAAFDEVARTARAEGIPFAGHVPADVGLKRAMESGMRTVEHLDGYVEALQKDGTTLPEQTGFFGSAIVDTVDEAKIAPLAAATRAAGAWNTPTQVLLDNLFGGCQRSRRSRRAPR